MDMESVYLVVWRTPKEEYPSTIVETDLNTIKRISKTIKKKGASIRIPKGSVLNSVSEITSTGHKTAKLKRIL
jgi:hypothetical protein